MEIFLDESGDLGFDFRKPATSRFFIITLLVLKNRQASEKLRLAVRRTLKNKVHVKKKAKKLFNELKGAKTAFGVKRYFYRHLRSADFSIYTAVLDKHQVGLHLRQNPERLYNFMSHSTILPQNLENSVVVPFPAMGLL